MIKSDKYFFQFKAFNVVHEINAQKIGTDSLLLGAWANLEYKKNVLDIGTGCGILSLMCAQRNEITTITALEIIPEYLNEAAHNFTQSKWKERIIARNENIYTVKDKKYDLIITNPPYFSNQLLSPNNNKNNVRHNIHFNIHDLPKICSDLLNEKGRLSIVLPIRELESGLIEKFENYQLFLSRICKVSQNPKRKPAIMLLEFEKKKFPMQESHLFIKDVSGNYTKEYEVLMRDFLIIFQ